MAHTYERIFSDETTFRIRQHHSSGMVRWVDPEYPGYIKALADGEVTDVPYVPPPPVILPLEEYKLRKIREFQKRTRELMDEGFLFDGKVFPLDRDILGDWAWLAIYDILGKLEFPRDVSTKDFGSYTISSKQVFSDWCDAGLATASAYRDGERTLRVAVLAAVDEAGVDTVVDERVRVW